MAEEVIGNDKISAGNSVMDSLLEGGFDTDAITTIYGPAGSGKTNFCILALSNIPEGKKAIYIDTEGSFSVSRFMQVHKEPSEVMKKIIFINPTTFQEQRKSFEKLKQMINESICLVILDSVAMLYRLEIGKGNDISNVNRELGLQIGFLSEIARKNRIPVIITNQVYSDFEDKSKINMVGGDLLKYQSKCLIEIQKLSNKRRAVLRKHRSLPDGKEIFFKITQDGVEKTD